MKKADIRNFTLKELETLCAGAGYPAYRARQLFFWLYRKNAAGFKGMNNLPKDFLDTLERGYYIGGLELAKKRRSRDGTEKFLFRLSDGNFIETVLIPAGKRKTVCISTQIGCKFACSFCASGRKGFVRDLTPSEVTNQILYLQNGLKHKITNCVFMGMGEPLDNYDNVAKAIMIMNSPEGMNIGAGRITVSTCGIISGIKRLKETGLRVNLSVSLHAAKDNLRSALMPINKTNPLDKLIESCADYIAHTKRKITLEYILLKDINDSSKDAKRLSGIAKRLNAKVNIIPHSRIPGLNFSAPAAKEADIFVKRLKEEGARSTLRCSKGADIEAACGQLACRAQNEI